MTHHVKLCLSNLFVFLYVMTYGQDTLVLKPDSNCGEDAYIWELSTQNGPYGPTEITNYGNSTTFLAHEWTWNGFNGRRKSLINFDLSLIPPGSLILDARLDLFGFPNSSDGGHSSASGSNESILRRITSPWTEQTVTWDTQPSFTTSNEVYLSQSNNNAQDYIGIDVTSLVQDMINNPLDSYGFMLSMAEQIHYRAMIFASSDHPDPMKHPQISIIYESSEPVQENAINLIPDTTICEFEQLVIDIATPCSSYLWSDGSSNSYFSTSQAGEYWVQLTTSTGVYIDTFSVHNDICSVIIELPNVFTPNNDNINDLFKPIRLEGIESMTLQIINRWGQTVFDTSSLSFSWDGTGKNTRAVSDGVYFWLIKYKTKQGILNEQHGYVHLVR